MKANAISFIHEQPVRQVALSPTSAIEKFTQELERTAVPIDNSPKLLQVLLVSAAPEVRRNLRDKLSPLRWAVCEAGSGAEAIEKLLEAEIHVMLIDTYLPDLNVVEFTSMVEAQFPATQVVGLSDVGQIAPTLAGPGVVVENKASAQPNGATTSSTHAYSYAHATTQTGRGWGGMIGTSPVMQRVYHATRLVSRRDTTVLILGESGTGKDLVARALHANSTRDKQPYVVINCAAIPEALLEAELFGYTKGSFTGAVQSRIGRIHAAHGGTLFLDEIGDMPYPLQSKILRFLEGGEVQRLGGTDTLKVDCRVVAATNANLKKLAQSNLFREDLYYRLAVFPIQLPPLRERMDDLGSLTESFLSRFCPGVALSPEAWQVLCSHSWPGNIRELRNVLERASLYAETRREIRAEDIVL